MEQPIEITPEQRIAIWEAVIEHYTDSSSLSGICGVLALQTSTPFKECWDYVYDNITILFPELLQYKPADVQLSHYWWRPGDTITRLQTAKQILADLQQAKTGV